MRPLDGALRRIAPTDKHIHDGRWDGLGGSDMFLGGNTDA
jgi:hypothetical protein